MSWWEELHFNLANLVAGFMGGVVNAFVLKRSSPVSVIGSVVVGALTANYLGTAAAKGLAHLPYLDGTTEPVAAFLVGMMGMGFVQSLMAQINKRFRAPEKEAPQ